MDQFQKRFLNKKYLGMTGIFQIIFQKNTCMLIFNKIYQYAVNYSSSNKIISKKINKQTLRNKIILIQTL